MLTRPQELDLAPIVEASALNTAILPPPSGTTLNRANSNCSLALVARPRRQLDGSPWLLTEDAAHLPKGRGVPQHWHTLGQVCFQTA